MKLGVKGLALSCFGLALLPPLVQAAQPRQSTALTVNKLRLQSTEPLAWIRREMVIIYEFRPSTVLLILQRAGMGFQCFFPLRR